MESKHKHAELMMQYAEDAMKHEFPYILWQYNITGEWHDLNRHPEWDFNTKYRRKPIEQNELISINVMFMKPLKVTDIKFRDPEQFVHYPSFDYDKCRFNVVSIKVSSIFGEPPIVVHTTKENAQEHVNTLNKIYFGV
jgi:hypothetical protein|nr:MAG TPA: hypothetical protein [Bacteriophage sp.]